MPRIGAGSPARPGGTRSWTAPGRRSAGTGTRARPCGCWRRQTGLSRGAIFHHFRGQGGAVPRGGRAGRRRRWPRRRRARAGPGDARMIADGRRRLGRHAAGGLPPGAHRPGVPRRCGDRTPTESRPPCGPGCAASGTPASSAPTSTSTGWPRYLELVQEGLVAHLAAGLPADRLDAVLDLVEGSVRR